MQRYACKARLSSLLRTIYVKPQQVFCQKVLDTLKLYRIRANSAKFNNSNTLSFQKHLPDLLVTILRTIPYCGPWYADDNTYIFVSRNYNNPLFPHFSISTKILNHFEVSLFSFLTFPADTGRNGLPSLSRKVCNLIAGKHKRWQSDKP